MLVTVLFQKKKKLKEEEISLLAEASVPLYSLTAQNR